MTGFIFGFAEEEGDLDPNLREDDFFRGLPLPEPDTNRRDDDDFRGEELSDDEDIRRDDDGLGDLLCP